LNSATAAPTDPLAVQPVTTARAAHNTQRKGQGKADGTRLSCHSCVWEQKDELMNLEQARIAANAAAQEYLATDDFPEATNRFLDLIETLLDDLNREPGTKCSGSGGSSTKTTSTRKQPEHFWKGTAQTRHSLMPSTRCSQHLAALSPPTKMTWSSSTQGEPLGGNSGK